MRIKRFIIILSVSASTLLLHIHVCHSQKYDFGDDLSTKIVEFLPFAKISMPEWMYVCVCVCEGFACLTAIFACAFLFSLLRIIPLLLFLLLILSSQHKVLIFFSDAKKRKIDFGWNTRLFFFLFLSSASFRNIGRAKYSPSLLSSLLSFSQRKRKRKREWNRARMSSSMPIAW